MIAPLSPWGIEFDSAGLATISRETGRLVERLTLTPAFSGEVAKLDRAQLTAGLLSALWRQAEQSPEELIAARVALAVTVH